MEEFISKKINLFRNNKIYDAITAVIFPVLIVIFGLWKVNQGIDITDTAYSLSNFRDPASVYDMWFFSTFYANLVGRFLVQLPGGNSLLWMNVFTGLFKVFTALSAYYFFTKAVKIGKELSALGVIVALGLCWCPTTILYNYLTYFFFFLGVAFLYSGLMNERKINLVIAGFFLGCNLFVRLPNAAETILIFAVFFYSFCKKEKFSVCLNKTLLCIGGYFLAFVPAAVLILINKGFKAYFLGIAGLAKINASDPSYSVINQLVALCKTYISTWTFIEPTFFMLVLSMLVFLVLPSKLSVLRYGLTTIISVVFGVIMFNKGITIRYYQSYATIVGITNLMLVIIGIFFIVTLILKKAELRDKILAVMGIAVIIATPLGSNNSTYTNFNNMFFVLPAFLFLLTRFTDTNEYFRGVRFSIMLLTLAFAFQSIGFGLFFSFRDGTDGMPRDSYVSSIESVKGVKTTSANAAILQEFGEYWNNSDSKGKKLLLYGNVCGMGYYLDTDIAIESSWPSLNSFSAEDFEMQLDKLMNKIINHEDEYPIVIISKEESGAFAGETETTKQEILKKFLEESDYFVDYSNDRLMVLKTNK